MGLNFVGSYQIQPKSYEQNRATIWNSGKKITTSLFSSLKVHNWGHSISIAASGIPCPLCPKKFSSGRTLSDHHKQVHDKTNHIPCPHTPVQIDIKYIGQKSAPSTL